MFSLNKGLLVNLVITTIIYVVIRTRLLNTLQIGMDLLYRVLMRKYKVILHK